MPMYVGEFSYKVEEWGTVTLEADDEEQADMFVREHVREAFPDATDITIDTLKVL